MVDSDERIKNLLELVKRKKEFYMKDKDEALKTVNKHFEALYRRLEERKN